MKPCNIIPKQIKIGQSEVSVISLGEEGRGRKNVLVSCPAEFDFLDFVGESISPSGIKKKAKLVESSSSEGWVARLSSEGAYIRGARGQVFVPKSLLESGEIKLIAKGYGAFGDAGRTGTWDDVIVVLPDNCVIKVKPTRGDSYLVHFGAEKSAKLTKEEASLLADSGAIPEWDGIEYVAL